MWLYLCFFFIGSQQTKDLLLFIITTNFFLFFEDSGSSKALMVRPLKVEHQPQVISFSPNPNYRPAIVTVASIANASSPNGELNHKNSSTLLLPSIESPRNQDELSLDDVEMKAFYASLDVKTSFKSSSQDTTDIAESSNNIPCEEFSNALKTLQDLLSKDFSVLLQTGHCGTMKSTIEYLSKMSATNGISAELRLLISEVSREFTRWSCDYSDASKKIESASSNIIKADKLEESLEGNKKEFNDVLSLENDLYNQLATLDQRKKELEEQINAIKANISVFHSAKVTATKRKREVFEEAKTLKAERDELREQVPHLKEEREVAKKIQENIQAEWLKLGEKINKSLNVVNSEDLNGQLENSMIN
jgi:hypothetical protein